MVLLALLHIFQAALGLCPGTAGGQGDPHLYGAHGGHTDFRGRENTFFNVVSHQKMSANVKTKDGEFRLQGATINGSWMVEFHLVAPTTAGLLHWTYDAARISPASLLGFSNGTCGDVPFKLTGSRMGKLLRNGPLQRRVCGDVVLQVRLA